MRPEPSCNCSARYCYFNPRTPVGCDLAVAFPCAVHVDFNPRTPVGCDHRGALDAINQLFQSTHPSGVRRLPANGTKRFGRISIHAPQWGATKLIRALCHRYRYFNPRTPVGCDGRGIGIRRCCHISIHAPQWGATLASTSMSAMLNDFNPRTPVGCDTHPSLNPRTVTISIHAPQWGATWRPRVIPIITIFQSTHPSGVRRRSFNIFRTEMNFNPRTPVGCDYRALGFRVRPSIFQSTHPSGVRRLKRLIRSSYHHFNPRTPVGCDRHTRSCNPPTGYFNPRTPVGCDS